MKCHRHQYVKFISSEANFWSSESTVKLAWTLPSRDKNQRSQFLEQREHSQACLDSAES